MDNWSSLNSCLLFVTFYNCYWNLNCLLFKTDYSSHFALYYRRRLCRDYLYSKALHVQYIQSLHLFVVLFINNNALFVVYNSSRMNSILIRNYITIKSWKFRQKVPTSKYVTSENLEICFHLKICKIGLKSNSFGLLIALFLCLHCFESYSKYKLKICPKSFCLIIFSPKFFSLKFFDFNVSRSFFLLHTKKQYKRICWNI